MGAILGAAVTRLIGWFAAENLVAGLSKVTLWAIQKAFLITLMTVTFPLVLKGVIGWFISEKGQFILSKFVDIPTLPPIVYEFTGLGAYFAVQFRLIDCITILLSGLLIHFTLRFIPGF